MASTAESTGLGERSSEGGEAHAYRSNKSGRWLVLVVAFLLAGSGIGLAETAESALVAPMLPRLTAR